MVNFATGPMLRILKQKDMSKKILLPELSATYCFALLKAKGREINFDPKDYLPEECLKENNSRLIMPYHLNEMLQKLNLKLSHAEFQKLWQRFDLNNIGGIKSQIFLRLMEYNRNRLDELSYDADKLRTKSCIVDLTQQPKQKQLINLNSSRSLSTKSKISLNKSTSRTESILSKEEINSNAVETEELMKTETVCNSSENSLETNSSVSNITLTSETISNNETKNSQVPSPIEFLAENKKQKNRTCKSTLSENRIKSMVHLLKNTNRFGPNDDLTVYLNNKVIIFILLRLIID